MRLTRLLPLVVLLAVLTVAVIVLKWPPRPTQLADEVGFERLVPTTLQTAAIQGLDLYQGSQPDKVVQLRRKHDAWIAVSHYNAPVQTAKLAGLLATLQTLSGELRSNQTDLLDTFHLTDAEALHLRVYTTDLTTPAMHLLAGKGSGHNGFMRVANDPRVYSVNMNLHQEAGLHGNRIAQPPVAKPWLNLQMHSLAQEHLTVLELHTPTRRLQLVRQPVPASAKSVPSAPTPQAPKTSAWKLVIPNLAYHVKQGYVSGMLNTLATLRGDDIVDPAFAKTSGLDTPTYRAIMTLQPREGEVQLVSLLVGNEVPGQAGNRYARLGNTGYIYMLPAWSLQQLFPKLGRILAIPLVAFHPQDVTHIAWKQDDTSWTVQRRSSTTSTPSEEGSWSFATGAKSAVDTHTVVSLLNTVRDLTAEDWLETPPQQVDLARPVLTLALTEQNGKIIRLTVSAEHGAERLHYTRLHNSSVTFAISTVSYHALTEALTQLRPTQAASTP